MASISTDTRGNRLVQFVAPNGRRRTVRLGRVPMKSAEAIRTRIELIVAATVAQHPMDAETARWVANLDRNLANKLAQAGLISPRRASTLATFVDEYIASRTDVKPGTRLNLGFTRNALVECLGEDTPVSKVSPADADHFRRWLLERGRSENTTRRYCGRAKQFFRAACRAGLIEQNPFADVVSNVKGNPSRFYFVSRDEAVRVLEACPDHEWRLLFALARFGGLRVPSEPLALRWSDVDWERGRLRVPSPKTEHHEGRECRVIPIFPELRRYLEDAWELASPGAEFVIGRYRDSKANLRTQFERIIRRAGLTPWPKPWQNCRSTRETELAEAWPIQVACAWIGNTQAVAQKHYLQVTDEHFARASQGGPAPRDDRSAEVSALQNPVQQGAARPCQAPQNAGDDARIARGFFGVPQGAEGANYPARIRT